MKGIMPSTTTATELQRNYKKVRKRAERLKEPLTILSNNKPEGVYMDYDTFRKFSAKMTRKVSRKKSNVEKFFGTWTKEEADKFDSIIEDAFEQINPESWK